MDSTHIGAVLEGGQSAVPDFCVCSGSADVLSCEGLLKGERRRLMAERS